MNHCFSILSGLPGQNSPSQIHIIKCSSLASIAFVVAFFLLALPSFSQVILNEGSNKNYSITADENGEFEDWIEILNSGSVPVDLYNYSLSDNSTPGEWKFPHQIIQPNEHILVFCSGKDRYVSTPFKQVYRDTTFQPQTGWNVHHFTSPFDWDGISNVVVNICIYDDTYTNNSIHLQSSTTYNATIATVADGASACNFPNGVVAKQRPNLRLNGMSI